MKYAFLVWNPVSTVPIFDFVIDAEPIKVNFEGFLRESSTLPEVIWNKVSDIQFVRRRSGLFIFSFLSESCQKTEDILLISKAISNYIMSVYFGHIHSTHIVPPKLGLDFILQNQPVKLDLSCKVKVVQVNKKTKKNISKNILAEQLKLFELITHVDQLKAKKISSNPHSQYALLAIRARHSRLADRCVSSFTQFKKNESVSRYKSIYFYVVCLMFSAVFLFLDNNKMMSVSNFHITGIELKSACFLIIWLVFSVRTIKSHLKKEEFLLKFEGYVNCLKPYSTLVENIYVGKNLGTNDQTNLYETLDTGNYDSLIAKISNLTKTEQNNSKKHISIMMARLTVAGIIVAIIAFSPLEIETKKTVEINQVN